ncbi:MAG: DUF192 domain-containing protein [Candidatus Moranbacteria bacterium]|nr:DUF192 domain-containing protein [Candidatus Moranbacteria bacterium]MBP6034287.1 DUF192 domain-containing protein [Candidatus Moranbacteria bacterium]MBP7695887.1 DUF192 domain-containing protein [Candidatus Moranbacteria bacterium]
MRAVCIIGVVLLLGVGGCAGWSYFFASSDQTLLAVGWQGNQYAIEIADTPELWGRGLSGRDDLCAACSMLFVFPRAERHDFWMKGMRFPLDIIWVSGGKVVYIERRIDPTSAETFRPDVAADQVIEVNAGAADRLREGDRIDYYSE